MPTDVTYDLRPIDPEADVETLFEVAYACEAAVVAEPDTTRADLRSLFTTPNADVEAGARMAVDGDTVVGFTSAEADHTGRRVFVDVYVRPEADGSAWDALMSHALAFAQDTVAALPREQRHGWALAAGAYAQDHTYAAVLSRWGLQPVRRFHRMEVLFDEAVPPVAPVPPPEVTLEVTGEDEEQLRLAHTILEQAFREHWQHHERTYDEFIGEMRAESYDPSQWWIASVDGRPAGICLGNDHLAELGIGYVSSLGVLQEFRGRGLARLLLHQAFAQAYQRGRHGVRLGVDTGNDTGALELYTAVGMHVVEAIDAYRRPLG